MKKTNQKTEQVSVPEQVSKLQPFPFIENEDYLLKLKSGDYAVAYWNQGQFYSGFGDLYIEEEIVGIVALKDLGVWKEDTTLQFVQDGICQSSR